MNIPNIMKNPNYTNIPGQVTSFSLAPNGFVCATNSADGIFFLQNYKNWGSGWKMGPGRLRQIHTDGTLICGTNSNNNAFSANFANAAAGQWTVLPSVLTKIVTYQGKYYCVGLDRHIYYLTSPTSQWVMTLTSGVFNDISIDEGVILLIGTDNKLYYTDSNLFSPSGQYQQVPNQPTGFKSVSVSKGSIFAISTNGEPWYSSNYKNTNWAKVPGSVQEMASHRVITP
jgi:hypothetical protein